MTGSIFIQAANVDGVLERVLGVVRFRGFLVTNMQADCPTPSQMQIHMRVTGQRSVEHLGRQLDRLIDISEVKVNRPRKDEHREPVMEVNYEEGR